MKQEAHDLCLLFILYEMTALILHMAELTRGLETGYHVTDINWKPFAVSHVVIHND